MRFVRRPHRARCTALSVVRAGRSRGRGIRLGRSAWAPPLGLSGPGVIRTGIDAVFPTGREIEVAAMTIHAARRSMRLTAWLSRNGDSIVLALPGSKELMFEENAPGPSDGSHWEMLDRILRSIGR
jgi:hypothetical protein